MDGGLGIWRASNFVELQPIAWDGSELRRRPRLGFLNYALFEFDEGFASVFLYLGGGAPVIANAIINRHRICVIGILGQAAHIHLPVQSLTFEVQVNPLHRIQHALVLDWVWRC